jgi:hypothetical protein
VRAAASSAAISCKGLSWACRILHGIGTGPVSSWRSTVTIRSTSSNTTRRRPTRRAFTSGCCCTARASVATTNAVNDGRSWLLLSFVSPPVPAKPVTRQSATGQTGTTTKTRRHGVRMVRAKTGHTPRSVTRTAPRLSCRSPIR